MGYLEQMTKHAAVLGLFLISISLALAVEEAVTRSPELVLTKEDWREVVRILSPATRRQLLASEANLREMALDVHSDAVLAKRAAAEGLERDPMVRARLAKARRDILAAAYMDKVVASIEWPDFSVLSRQRYEADKEKFRIPQKRKVAHILVRPKPKNCPCDDRDPEQILKEIRAKIEQGADFSQLASEYSADKATAAKGGLLDLWIEPDDERLVPAFAHAVFTLKKPGDVSEPVKTRYGWHIIKLLEIQPSRQQSYEEVKDRILRQLRAEYRDSQLEELRSETYPDPDAIDYEALRKLLAGEETP